MSICGTRELRGTAAFEHKEGKCRPRILWEHLSDKFALSYSRCDATRRYGVESCPVGVEWRDVSLLTYGAGRHKHAESNNVD